MAILRAIVDFLKAWGRSFGAELAGLITLIMGYVAISLFDPWARLLPFIHVLALALLLTFSILVFALRSRRGPAAFPWVRLAIFSPLLLLGVYTAGDDAARRIYVGFTPAYITPAPVMQLDVTVTPPAYTGLKPLVLARLAQTPSSDLIDNKPIQVPAGSIITVTARGKGFQPSLVWGHSSISLRPRGQGKFSVTGKIEADTEVEIRQGSKRLAAWPLVVVADRAPVARLAGAPRFTGRNALRVHVVASDDYGVKYLALKMSLKGDKAGAYKLVDLTAYGLRSINEAQYVNLLSHPWAGQTVTALLVAVDGAGHEGESAPFDLKLPLAKFHNPLSQQLTLVRQNILEGDAGLKVALQQLGALISQPEESRLDVTTYLGLRTAYSRLGNDTTGEHKKEIAALLWDLAVLAEDGGLSNAQDDLGLALDRLRFAVKTQASADDVSAMVGRLNWALRAYDNNRSTALYRAGQAHAGDPDEGLDWPALTKFLNTIVDLAGKGDYARISGDLDDLKEGLEERGDLLLSAGTYRRFMMAGQAHLKLTQVLDRQQGLLARLQESGGNLAVKPRQQLLADQRALLNALEQVMPQGNKATVEGDAIEAAARLMSDALGDIARNKLADAARAQGLSLVAIKKAVMILAKAPSPVGSNWAGRAQDPLGRPLPGVALDASINPNGH